MVRILIVEDQRIMQKYFESIIMREPEFRHVQTVSDACEAVKICSIPRCWKEQRADVQTVYGIRITVKRKYGV